MKSVIGIALLVVIATSSNEAAFVNPFIVCADNCAHDYGTDQGCFSMPDKLYQTCSDCFRYIRCQGGKVTERRNCTGGWWFSTVSQTCLPPVDGCCGCYCDNPFSTTTTKTTTTTTRPTTTTTTTTTTPAPTTPVATTPAPTAPPTQQPTPSPNPDPSRPCVGTGISTGYGCIKSSPSACNGLPDGDYQACEVCTYYHSCVAGYLNYAFRPCPRTDQGGLRGFLIWQQAANKFNVGTCERSSTTCKECVNGYETIPTQTTTRSPTQQPTQSPNPDPSRPCVGTDISTGYGCITSSPSSCNGLPDGDYQACEGCTYYHSCVAGYLNYAFRPCPLTNQGGLRGFLVWQQAANKFNVGTCEYSSTTCKECVNEYNTIPTQTTTRSPNQQPTQSPNPDPSRPCVGTDISTGYGCIKSTPSACNGLPDGDYQACEVCTYYHSCVAGYLNYAFRPCPRTNQGGLRGFLVWQQAANKFNVGTCEYSSTTCKECVNGYEPIPIQSTLAPTSIPVPPRTTVAPPPSDCQSTGRDCITKNINSCQGLPDGDYQACEDCATFYKCSNGYIYKFDCPLTDWGGLRGKLIWQQWTVNTGRCERESTSCKECDIIYPRPPTVPTTIPPPVSTTTRKPDPWVPCDSTGSNCISAFPGACQGRADGHYQACEGCTIYHSCSGGVLYSSRLCAETFSGGLRGRLVWRQVTPTAGICDYTSNTCTECDPSPLPTPSPTCPPFPRCVHQSTNCSAAGLPDGDYQVCQSCFHYLTCRGGDTIACQECPTTTSGKQKFVIKTPTTGVCEDTSSTCNQCPFEFGTTQKPPVTPTPTPPPTVSPTKEEEEESWTPCQSTGSSCLAAFPGACIGRADGHYQACEGCTIYHSCSGGVLYSSRLCAKTFSGGLRGRLVWRQVTPTAGICDYTSNTCTECVTEPTPTVSPTCPPSPRCVHSSANCSRDKLVDGDYQICQSCFHYLSCRSGETWPCRPCPSYNDRPYQWKVTSHAQGYCAESSDTCNQCPISAKSGKIRFLEEVKRLELGVQRKSTGSSCITGLENSCERLADGDYQACESCSVYHSCVEGTIFANRNCPFGLVWQTTGVGEGRCDYTSTSCRTRRLRKTFEDVFF